MSTNMANQIQPKHMSQEDLLTEKVTEIEALEKLIDSSLVEIKHLQGELMGLGSDLNNFLDHYYGSGAMFFKDNNAEDNGDHHEHIEDLAQAKKDIYEKIAKVCSTDTFHFDHNEVSDVRTNLLKIEEYLTNGSDQSQSPQDMLSALSTEYSTLMKMITDLKDQKEAIIHSPEFELKQEVLWTNVKKSETISKIKEDLTHQVNRHS